MTIKKTDIADILAKPYGRLVIPDVDGSYSAEIVEFSGCIASGDTAAEALENLESVAADWIVSAIEQGQNIPEPMDSAGYSGKLVVRMPKSLHQRAAMYAERDGASLNQFIVTCLAEYLGTRAQPKMVVSQPTHTLLTPMLFMNVASIVASPALAQPSQAGQSSGQTFLMTPIEARPHA